MSNIVERDFNFCIYKGPPAQAGKDAYRHYLIGYSHRNPIWDQLREKYGTPEGETPSTTDEQGNKHFWLPGPSLWLPHADLSNHHRLRDWFGTNRKICNMK